MHLANLLICSVILGPSAPLIHANAAAAHSEPSVQPAELAQSRAPEFPLELAATTLFADLDDRMMAATSPLSVEQRTPALTSVSAFARDLLPQDGRSQVNLVRHLYMLDGLTWTHAADLTFTGGIGIDEVAGTMTISFLEDLNGSHPLAPVAGWRLEEHAKVSFGSGLLDARVIAATGAPEADIEALLHSSVQRFERTLSIENGGDVSVRRTGADVTWEDLLRASQDPADASTGSMSYGQCLLLCLTLAGIHLDPPTLFCLALGFAACANADDFDLCAGLVLMGCTIVLAITEIEILLGCAAICLAYL